MKKIYLDNADKLSLEKTSFQRINSLSHSKLKILKMNKEYLLRQKVSQNQLHYLGGIR